jgi:hypothetical protein
LADIYKLGHKMYQDKDPTGEPQVQPLAVALAQNSTEHNYQSRESDQAGERIKIHDESVAAFQANQGATIEGNSKTLAEKTQVLKEKIAPQNNR